MPENPMVKQILEKPPEKWTILNLSVIICELYADIKHIRNNLNKKANKWVEKIMVLGAIGIVAWVGERILSLITEVQAFF